MIDFGRVQKELQECSKDIEASGIKVTPKGDSLSRLLGTIPGPIGTPYEGGAFQIDITLPGSIPPHPDPDLFPPLFLFSLWLPSDMTRMNCMPFFPTPDFCASLPGFGVANVLSSIELVTRV